MIKSLVILSFLLFTFSAIASERTVRLEWDADNEAISYQVEMGKKGSQTPFQSFSDLMEPRWSGLLLPGKYWMRIRGKDDRGIPGEWGDKISFHVKHGFAQAVAPTAMETVPALNESHNVTFEWKPLKGSFGYSFTLLKEDGSVATSKHLQENSLSLPLASGQKYSWFVQGLDEEGTAGEKPENQNEFVLMGPSLPQVQIKKPESNFIRQLEIIPSEFQHETKISILRFDPLKKDWQIIKEVVLPVGKKLMPFSVKWPGGKYQALAMPVSKHRKPTMPFEISFDVANGTRSIAAENQALIRKSLDRAQDSYLVMTYIISQINYQAQLIAENRIATLSALAGTASVGYGYIFAESSWGLYGNLDYGGMLIESSNHTFMGIDALVVYRLSPTRSSDLRIKFGVFQRQIPELVSATPTTKIANINLMGPQLNLEYWYSLSPKWAIQTSLDYRLPQAAKSSQGKALENVQMQQYGLQAAYKYSPGLSALAGYSYKQEKFSFQETNVGLNASGTSSFDFSGHYLKLSLEYDY